MKTPYKDYTRYWTKERNNLPITIFELKDKRRYALRSFAEIQLVEPDREVVLVFGTKVYFGFTEGRVDADGDLLFKTDRGSLFAYGLPASMLLGWAYADNNF